MKINSFLVSVAYDGSDFFGWAKQPNKLTIQGCIESTLSNVFFQKTRILSASRTDRGVHAYDQKFTLRVNLSFSALRLLKILRKSLSKYVLVKGVKKVNDEFHPIKQVIKKEYRYFINIGNFNIFQKKYCWEYNLPIKTKKLNNLLATFLGKHDFFNYSHCREKEKKQINTWREIISLKSWKRDDTITISVIAKNFLRYQIRAIIGEVINCYEGKQTKKDLKRKLENTQQKNQKYKNLAPASGLYLWKINY